MWHPLSKLVSSLLAALPAEQPSPRSPLLAPGDSISLASLRELAGALRLLPTPFHWLSSPSSTRFPLNCHSNGGVKGTGAVPCKCDPRKAATGSGVRLLNPIQKELGGDEARVLSRGEEHPWCEDGLNMH